MIKVFVEAEDSLISRMFTDWQYEIVKDYEEADIIVFSGGIDVHPFVYGEDPSPYAGHYNSLRDLLCVGIYNYAITNMIPMIGICRGAQFITVMQGGKLLQHISGHDGGEHRIDFSSSFHRAPENFFVNSVHHQAMVPYDESIIGAKSADGIVEVTFDETEGSWEFCVQAHPEYVHEEHPFQVWFMNCVAEFYNGDY